ncbi:SAP domain-containing ribonucleoprotein [Silurus asotus]|uniref:SAP domain-containing ribonucleoprotein n=1 Tax=Silurus asotus TaxID=30991 RepID=A0AAD5ADI3_SILAS|nr:SAP domain-containing ribonucleoprotein [Silurus asotus]
MLPLEHALMPHTRKPVYIEKMRKREERFGMSVSPVYKKFPEEQKLKKRKERFGTVTSAASFGAYYLEVYIEKMRKRAERFGMIVSPVYKKVNRLVLVL